MMDNSAILQKILVLGCGELGTEVLKNLNELKTDKQVYVLVREPKTEEKKKKLDQWKEAGVLPICFDLLGSSEEEISGLFNNFDAVITCIGYGTPLGTQRKITKSVLKAKVKLYIPWQFGVDYDAIGYGSGQDVFDEQLQVRELIRAQSQTDWIIISTGVFMSYLFEPFFGIVDIENSRINALGSWSNTMTFTTPEDIGKLTAQLILKKYPKTKNEVVYVAGDTVSFGDVHKKISDFLGKELDKSVLTVDELLQSLKENSEGVAKYRLVFAKGIGVSWDKKFTFNEMEGIPVEDISTYLKKRNPFKD